MSTKFILHGGNSTTEKGNNKQFFETITTSIDKSKIKVLLCFWSKEKSKWDDAYQKYTKSILTHSEKNIQFEITKDPQDFSIKINDFDVFYVVGGDADRIEPYYEKLQNLKEQLEGKVYVGGSMGAFMVSSNYVLSFDNQDYLTVHNGLSLLKINLLCHWDVEKRKSLKIKMLNDHLPELPILTLKEGEFVEFVV